MQLQESQKKYLRRLGHDLKPTVMIADAGLSEGVMAELDSTITHHELIKVSIRVGDRKTRDQLIKDLCQQASASLIQRIGNIALIYRENPENRKILLPRQRQT